MSASVNYSVQIVHPDDLFLDVLNPRLFGDTALNPIEKIDLYSPKIQEVVRQHLVKYHRAGVLVQSIQRSGFLSVDRIVVKRIASDGFVVIEGNRRLAAIKTVLGDYKRKVIDLKNEILFSLENLEVLEVNLEEKC